MAAPHSSGCAQLETPSQFLNVSQRLLRECLGLSGWGTRDKGGPGHTDWDRHRGLEGVGRSSGFLSSEAQAVLTVPSHNTNRSLNVLTFFLICFILIYFYVYEFFLYACMCTMYM